jgi:P4 family phage/plasmid primase-like protien
MNIKEKTPVCETGAVEILSNNNIALSGANVKPKAAELKASLLAGDEKYEIAFNDNYCGKGKPNFSDPATSRSLTYGFKVEDVSIEMLAEKLSSGCCIANICLNTDGAFHRRKDNFKSASFIAVDIDNDGVDANGEKCRAQDDYVSFDSMLTHPVVDNFGAIVYETHSSTNDWNRFRVVFVLKTPITDPKLFTRIIGELIGQLNGDSACTDVSRVFFGAKVGGKVQVIGDALDLSEFSKFWDKFDDDDLPVEVQRKVETKKAIHNNEYASTAITQAIKILDDSRPGNRHEARTKAAYLLGGYVGAGVMDMQVAQEGIRDAVKRNTDDFEKAWSTVENCMKEGLSKPIDLRSLTSSANGAKGGRPELNTTELVKDFTEQNKEAPYYFFRGDWHQYNGYFYPRLPKVDFEGGVVSWLQGKLPNNRIGKFLKGDFIMNMMTEEFSLIPSGAEPPLWVKSTETQPYFVPLKNGIVDIDCLITSFSGSDITTDFIADLSPAFFSTYGLDFSFDPDAVCPKWIKYLGEVQPTEEGRDVVQMLFGLSLIQESKYEIAFYLYGPAGTGKSVCLNVLTKLIGSDNVTCVPLHRFRERFALHPLTTHRLNIVGDMPTSAEQSTVAGIEGAFKDIVSGGLVDCEKKGQDIYTARATALNIFASNSLISFTDKSSGVWDRLRIIPFDQVFRGTDLCNNNLTQEIIAEELPGIFNWAVQGLFKLHGLQHFPEHPAGLEIKEQHRVDCDHERQFLDETVEFCNGGIIPCLLLYQNYQDWMRENGYRACGRARFTQAVLRIYPDAAKSKFNNAGKQQWCWQNLKTVKTA